MELLGYKLRYLATAMLGLTVFGFSHTLFALGLSDIDLYSNLGEPLKARITVLGASELKDESCLRLGPNSDLTQVNFMLGSASGGAAKLTLTSNNIVNDPIVNLSVIADCGTFIERHYVLLLDPPTISANNHSIEASTPIQITNDSVENTTTKQTIQKPKTSAQKTSRKKPAKRQTNRATQNKEQVSSQWTNNTQTSEANANNSNNNDASTNSTPKLSISGGSYVPSLNETGLRLDKALNLTPNTYKPLPVTAEDLLLEDELTVVNNRIAHLQTQINHLQQLNLKLSSDNTLKTKQLAQTKSKQTRLQNLLLFIGAILLLIFAYIAFAWLRRRQIETQANYAEALWLNTNKQSDEPNIDQLASVEEENDSDEEVTKKDSDMLPPAPVSSTFKPMEEEQPIVIEDDQAFSVLDHADVFLFHGRANLAIQLLQNYLIEHPKQSVTIWLFLLDLLAKENSKDLYEQTAADCKLYYNIKVPDFSQPETETIESLEDFPRLAQGLMEVWNTPSALIYLDDLIYNNRLTPRAGLPKNLIEELTVLKAIAQENVNPADAPPLDEKKLAEIKEKEALLEQIKTEKLEAIAKAEMLAKEQEASAKKETSFEFTLIDK